MYQEKDYGITILVVFGRVEHILQSQSYFKHLCVVYLELFYFSFQYQQIIKLSLITSNMPSQLFTVHRRIFVSYSRPIKFNSCLSFRFNMGISFDQLHKIILEIFFFLHYCPIRSDLILIKEILPRDSSKLIFFKHPPQHHLGHNTDSCISWKRDTCFIHSHTQHLLNIIISIWAVTEQHFIEDYSTRPKISLASIDLTIQNLRSHIQRRSQRCLSKVIRAAQSFTKTKVCQFQMSGLEEYIVRFNISMKNRVLMQLFHRENKLPKYTKSFFFRKFFPLSKKFFQSSLLTVLVDKIDI